MSVNKLKVKTSELFSTECPFLKEEFAKAEYKSYILIDFNDVSKVILDAFENYLNDLDVLLLVVTAYVVLLSEAALLKHHVDSLCVIHNIQPVADVLAVTVYGKLLARQYIVDDQRDELFRELVRSVVV